MWVSRLGENKDIHKIQAIAAETFGKEYITAETIRTYIEEGTCDIIEDLGVVVAFALTTNCTENIRGFEGVEG